MRSQSPHAVRALAAPPTGGPHTCSFRLSSPAAMHRAPGTGSPEVLDVIQHQLPERAARWATAWDADSAAIRQRSWDWEQCGGRTCGSGRWAKSVAYATSYARRESAAQRWIEYLAGNTVDRVLADTDTSQAVRLYAHSRAASLAVAAQHQARFDAYVLNALRGTGLDTPAPAAV